MFKWPSSPSPCAPIHELADFVELVCWRDGNTSVVALTQALGILEENEYHDGVMEEEELPNRLQDVFAEIESRAIACGGVYPFVIGDKGTTLMVPEAKEGIHLIYKYLLLCTRLNMNNNKIHAGIDGTYLLEEVAAEISQNYLGPNAESMVFGTAAGAMSFRDKVNDLCSRLGEGGGYSNKTNMRASEKDGKLDVVSWKHFSDRLSGKFIAFGQCKTGTNYRDSLAQLQPDSFCRKWMLSSPTLTPVRMFFVAEALPRGSWYNFASDAGLLFDRCRIMDFSIGVSEKVLHKVAKWTHAAAMSTGLPTAGVPQTFILRRKAMVAQLRTYTINRGMMDSWLKVFDEEIRPIHDKIGMPISATFVNADRNEFIWIRNFNSAEEIPAKEAAYFASDERKALGDKPTSHIAKIEVKVIETVLEPAGVAS